jgi:8-oxo-dGTP diphosphatase
VTVVVGAVIVREDGLAYVQRRGPDRALLPGCWDIPGGHVEPGETPLEALGREIHEETGWRLRRVVAELAEVDWTGNDGVTRHELDYLVEIDGDLQRPRLERAEHVEFDWIGLDDVDRLLDCGRPQQLLLRDIVVRGLQEALGAGPR